MNKPLLITLGLAAALAVTGATIKHFMPLAVPSAAEQQLTELKFFATMNQSLEWTDNGVANMQYAIYELTPGASKYFSRLSAVESAKVADAGVYYDGNYYTVKVPSSNTYSNYVTTFTRYDVDTWEATHVQTFGNGNSNIAEDMTVDYISGNVYAVGNNVYMGSERQLKTVDLATGEMTRVAALDAHIYALAADGEGQLWGVGSPMGSTIPTNLYKVDKTTGATTLVAPMSINLYTGSLSSLTFDLRTGKLYYVAQTYVENENNEREWTNGLFEINTSTGNATLVQDFEYKEILAGLAMRDCHPKAPATPTELSYVFDAGSTEAGKVTCKLPEVTFDGTALSGTLSVEVTIDGEKVAEASGLTPGAEYASGQLSMTPGSNHSVKVFCYSGTLKSVPAEASVFAGTDTPAAPENLAVTLNEDGNVMHVTWDAAKSVNGGYIDETKLLYDVKLMPDGTVLASDLKATEFDYTFENRNMGVSQIRVCAKIDEATSSDAISSIFVAGTPWPLPYLEAFNYSGEAMWPFTVIDANHDESDYGFRWYFGPNQRAAWYYCTPTAADNGADDWLITPAIAFESDKVYRLQFDTYGYMGGVNAVDVVLGSHPVVEKMTHKIHSVEYETPGYSASQPYSVECLFIANATDARVGFHNVSNNTDHMFLDNIYISVYGTTGIPESASDLNAELADGGVKLTFKAPSLTAGGQKLSSLKDVKIYRTNADGEVLKTFTAPAPGEALEFVDVNYGTGLKTYMVVASNDEGAGMQATVSINTYADVPRAVENFTMIPHNGWSDAMLEWNYPASMTGVNGGILTEEDITYDIYRTLNGSTALIAQGISGTSYFDNTCSSSMPEGRRQVYVSYRIVPRTNGGEGQASTTDQVLMGLSYQLPFNESWKMQSQQNYTWTMQNCSTGSSWYICSSTAYDPFANCQDGDYGQVSFSGARYGYSYGDYISPRIDVSNYANTKVSFYLYRSNDSKTQGSSVQIGFISEDAGREILPTKYEVYNTENGWEQYTVDIPEKYAKSNRLSVVFSATTANYKGQIHIDNMSVTGEQPQKEIKAERIVGGERCLIGSRNTYDVEVANIGTEDVSNITVNFYADGELVGTETIATIAAGESALAPFAYTPSLNNNERTILLKGVASCDEDGSAENNTIEATVHLTAPMLPYVTEITGDSPDTQSARIMWTEPVAYPHSESTTDDVDSYTAFAIDNIGDWITVDRDKQITAQISLGSGALTWDHAGEPQAFIVFNTAQAGTSAVIKPRSGSQCFISFAARSQNDDWLISPQLSGEAQTISFYAKCAYTTDLNERFELWASSGSPEVSDFSCISGDSPVIVSSYDDWTRYSFKLPEGTKFFAIRCVSSMQTGLMIDDITYSPMHPAVELWGFNVYRDGEKITPTEYGDYEYIDKGLEYNRTYSYAVSAVYDAGESIFSPVVDIKIDGSSAIDGVSADGSDTDIHAVAHGISVKAPAGALVSVNSVDGKVLYLLESAGSQTLPVAKGVYVVKAADKVVKIMVK